MSYRSTVLSPNKLSTSGASCVVVSVDYRLGPEQPYPGAVEDTEEVLQWVFKNGKDELSINPGQIAVGGSSRYSFKITVASK